MRTPVSICALVVSLTAAQAFDSVVVINEIRYAPAPGATEFVELRNLHGVDVSLEGWKLSGGVDFDFPADTILPGHGYLVVEAAPAQIPGSVGPLNGLLDNAGDTVRLLNQNDRIMDEVNYDDEGDWPVGADGSGASLSRREAGAASDPAAWTTSLQLGGTPGALNFPTPELPTRSTPVPLRSAWRYNTSGADPGPTWRTLAFVDSGWTEANADFAFGSGLLYEDPPPPVTEYGHWSILPWTGDADSQVSAAKTYTHKVDLFHGAPATVINGVTFDSFNAPAAGSYAGPNWSLVGANSVFNTNTTAPRNTMTAGSGSHRLLSEFYYGGASGNGSTLALSGLTPGEYYTLTCYATGWDARELRKIRVTPSNTGISTVIDEGARGIGGGMLVRYHYKAPASGQLSVEFLAMTIAPLTSWHHYGFSNEVSTAFPNESAVQGVTVSESSSEAANRAAVNSVNSAGLSLASGTHGTAADGAMWLTNGTAAAPNDPLPASITFDLGSSRNLTGLRVWNYNEFGGTDLTNRGAKDVEVFVSPDPSGETFTSAGTFVFTRATGSTTDVGERHGFAATQSGVRRVRLAIASHYGDALDQVGLAEVQFLTPYVYNGDPVPAKSVIPSLWNTGVDANRVAAAFGTTDLHWTAVSPPSPVPVPIVTSPHSAWAPASPTSNFIGFSATGTNNVAFGVFTFRTVFDLTGFVPGTEEIRFITATDNSLDDVRVNGAARGIASVGHNPFFGPYTIPGPFAPGTNTLDFVWANQGTAVGPGAMRVEWDARAARLPATALAANPVTTYFRRKFTLDGDPTSEFELFLRHGVDDGAVFYLNGQEIHRTNITGAVGNLTPADGNLTHPQLSASIAVPVTALIPNGENVLAVELHQAASGMADSYFDATLDVVETPRPPSLMPALVFSEITGATDPAFFVELRNDSGATLNTSGWTITTQTGEVVPVPVQSLSPGAYLTLNAAALGFVPTDGTRLFLLAPGGSELRDAREVTNRPRGLTADGRWGHPDATTPGTGNTFSISTAIVINEIYYNAPGDGPEQWIELHNRSAAAVDVGAWKLSDGVSYDIPPGTSIAAGGYLVIAWDPTLFTGIHPGVPALGPWSGSLSGAGEKITLRDADDNVADQLTYAENGRWSQWADGGGSSLELKDPDADNSVGEAWGSSDESLKTAWQTVTFSGIAAHASTSSLSYYHEFIMGLLDSGEVLIDDVSVRETVPVNRQLIQNGDFSSGTADKWRNIGTHRTSTVVDDPFSPGNKVLKIVASAATEHMNNHCETTLKDGATYVPINATATYEISFRAKWLRGTNRLHTRLYFNRLPKQIQLDRVTTGGTPGAVNSAAVANIGPSFTDLSVAPVVPLAGQSAKVRIAVSDPDGVTAADLFTSLDGGAFTSHPMTGAANGVYTAEVGPEASGAQVQFYVRATDGLGATATFPAAGPASRAMIPWQDGKSLFTLPSGREPHNLRVVMPAADANDMYQLENVHSNEYRPCTVIIDDRTAWYQAGTRLKSSEHGRFQDNRVGYNLKFGEDDLFLGAHQTISVDRSGNRDTTGIDGTGISSQREILVKSVMNTAGGIYTTEDDLIRIIAPVAAGTPPPAYTGVSLTGEAILSKSRFDDEYLDGQWDNGGDGPLFKQEFIYPLTQTIDPVTRAVTTIAPSGNLNASAENPKIPQTGGSPGPSGIAVQAYPAPPSIDPKEIYRWHWLLRNAREADDFSGLIAAVTAVGQGAGTPAFRTQTEATLEVDTWLRSVVVPQLFGIVDNYLGNTSATHNFILYFPPGGKGIAIPWDSDFLGQSNPNQSFTAGGNLNKFMADGANARRYYCHVLDVLNRSFNDDYLTRWATHYSGFGPDDMTSSLPYLRNRATYVRNVIFGTGGQTAPIPQIPFSLTTPSPVTVGTPTTTLTGDGWLDVDGIYIQGNPQPLPVTWTDNNSWSATVPVRPGSTTYTLEARRKDGTVAGTTTVTVIGSGGVFPAAAGLLLASEIHYNPAGSGDATEFIELLNITTTTLDLTGCHFDEEDSSGISFAFAAGTQMAPGARVTVARDPAAFAAAYPGVTNVVGPYTGALDNSGESIQLYAADGSLIFRFSYPDGVGASDGDGKSLIRVHSSSLPDPDEYTWRESMTDGGNPGATDAVAFAGDPNADLDHDGLNALLEYSLGSSDATFTDATEHLTVTPLGAGQWQIAVIAPLNRDDAVLTLESSADLSTWTPGSEGVIAVPDPRHYWRLRAALR